MKNIQQKQYKNINKQRKTKNVLISVDEYILNDIYFTYS